MALSAATGASGVPPDGLGAIEKPDSPDGRHLHATTFSTRASGGASVGSREQKRSIAEGGPSTSTSTPCSSFST